MVHAYTGCSTLLHLKLEFITEYKNLKLCSTLTHVICNISKPVLLEPHDFHMSVGACWLNHCDLEIDF